MPELPEVETIRRDLAQKILNVKIKKVILTPKAKVKGNKKLLSKVLFGNKIIEVGRVGKLLIFKLADKKNYLLVHLKMTGQLIYQIDKKIIAGGHPDPDLSKEPNKFTRISLKFVNNSELYFNDIRRFGYWQLASEKELEKIRTKYGLDPLTKEFTVSHFKGLLENKNRPIKLVLMDQALIAGIGNIYACEALFLARINPKKKAKDLKEKEIKDLYVAIRKVLRLAVEKRGTTFNDYVDTEGKTGYFAKYLKVYDRTDEPCARHDGGKIFYTKLGGRGTFHCPVCQK